MCPCDAQTSVSPWLTCKIEFLWEDIDLFRPVIIRFNSVAAVTKLFPIFNIRYPVTLRTDIKYAKISLNPHTISLERAIILLMLYFWNDLTTFPCNRLFMSCIQLMNMYRIEQERLHSLLNLGESLIIIWLIYYIIRNLNDYVARFVITIWWYVIKRILYNDIT